MVAARKSRRGDVPENPKGQPVSAFGARRSNPRPWPTVVQKSDICQLPPYFFVGHTFGIAPDAGCFLPVALGRLLIHYGSITLAVLLNQLIDCQTYAADGGGLPDCSILNHGCCAA